MPAILDLETQLAQMRAEGELDDIGEGVMRRHFEDRARTLAGELLDLLAEYEQRAGEHGQDDATRWLSEAAEALGHRDGEETRRILSTVVTAAS